MWLLYIKSEMKSDGIRRVRDCQMNDDDAPLRRQEPIVPVGERKEKKIGILDKWGEGKGAQRQNIRSCLRGTRNVLKVVQVIKGS